MKRFVFYSIIMLLVFTNVSFHSADVNETDFHIVIVKHKYELYIYDASNNLLIAYPAVFGNNDLSDKLMQGDRKTPEGIFHIVSKRPHEKWNKFLMLDYPTADSYRKFNERKAQGLIPRNAEIGGGIGIHGTWPREEFAVDDYQNWTQGCISTKNIYINKIYQYIPVGTQVEIDH